jgi:hypothetical protein
MRRRDFIVLLSSAALVPSSARAESAQAAVTLAARLVGTWEFQSSVNLREDGTGVDRWGANPKGMFIFGPDGHFTQIIIGEESRLFGAKSFFAFGTYSVDEANKTIIAYIEGSSIGRLNNAEQTRKVTSLTDDKLTYVTLSSNGTKVEAQWRRTRDAPLAASAPR